MIKQEKNQQQTGSRRENVVNPDDVERGGIPREDFAGEERSFGTERSQTQKNKSSVKTGKRQPAGDAAKSGTRSKY